MKRNLEDEGFLSSIADGFNKVSDFLFEDKDKPSNKL
jgi:hypothetical protein